MQHPNTLTANTITLLTPITRNHYTYTGNTQTVEHINPNGIDLHVDTIRTAALDPDGTAHPYMVLYPQAGTARHTRLAGGTTYTQWGFQLTVAAGSPHALRAALNLVTTTLTRTRLNPTTGILTPYFDQTDILADDTVTPPRWYAPLRYTTTAH